MDASIHRQVAQAGLQPRPVTDRCCTLPNGWENTEIGDLVSRGKYLYKKASYEAKLRTVGTALVERLDDVIEEHPVLRAVDTVVAVPGHDRLVVSFGSRLSRAVAKKRGLKFVQCRSIPEFRTPAKEMESGLRPARSEHGSHQYTFEGGCDQLADADRPAARSARRSGQRCGCGNPAA